VAFQKERGAFQNMKTKDYLGDLDEDGKTVSKWILNK